MYCSSIVHSSSNNNSRILMAMILVVVKVLHLPQVLMNTPIDVAVLIAAVPLVVK